MSDKNSQGLPWEHYKKTLKLSCLEDKKHYKFAMGSIHRGELADRPSDRPPKAYHTPPFFYRVSVVLTWTFDESLIAHTNFVSLYFYNLCAFPPRQCSGTRGIGYSRSRGSLPRATSSQGASQYSST